MPPHARLVPFGNKRSLELFVSDTASIGRIDAAKSAGHWNLLREPTIETDGPEFVISLLRRADASRCEDDSLSIRRPATNAIAAGMICQPLRVSSGRRDHVHFRVAGDGGGE